MVFTKKAYDEFIATLPSKPDEIISFKVPETMQRRMEILLQRNSGGFLNPGEQAELNRFVEFELKMRGLVGQAMLKRAGKV